MRMLLVLLALLLSTGLAAGQTASDVVRLELLPGWRQADGTHMAGLRISLAPGWKTYWRAPGAAGIPPSFDWEDSENLAAAQPHFPVPDVFRLNGVRTIGYGDSVVFPLAFRPRDEGQPISLSARVSLGVCETICIPFEARIEATLPAGTGGGEAAIRAALSDTPLTAAEAGVEGVGCHVAPIRDGLRLTATLEMPSLGRDETTVVELSDPSIWVSEIEASRQGGRLTAAADLVPPEGAPFALDRSSLRFTVLADGRAVEVRGCSAG